MIEQGTPEWLLSRCGKATGSRIADVCAKTKTGWGASRKNYEAQLIAERLTGTVADSFTNAAMLWGTETEPKAREVYEAMHLVSVEQVGSIDHPTIDMTSASPDGLVGDDGLVEIKCPNTATHIDTLLSKKVPKKYVLQMQWQMAVTGRKWCDFMSYDPRLPEHLATFIQRVDRDDDLIKETEETVSGFLDDLANKIRELEEI